VPRARLTLARRISRCSLTKILGRHSLGRGFHLALTG
jgi:hypothetical protein